MKYSVGVVGGSEVVCVCFSLNFETRSSLL